MANKKIKDLDSYGSSDLSKCLKDEFEVSKNEGTYGTPDYPVGSSRKLTLQELQSNIQLRLTNKITFHTGSATLVADSFNSFTCSNTASYYTFAAPTDAIYNNKAIIFQVNVPTGDENDLLDITITDVRKGSSTNNSYETITITNVSQTLFLYCFNSEWRLVSISNQIPDLSTYLEKNTPITASTKTKIAYDADGLVVGGYDADIEDILETTNYKRYSAVDKAKVADLSGVNTGDQDLSGKANIASPTFTGTVATPDIVVSNATASTPSFFDATKKLISMTGALLGTWFQTLPVKLTPVDADTIIVNDSASSFEAKKTTLTNFYAYLKSKIVNGLTSGAIIYYNGTDLVNSILSQVSSNISNTGGYISNDYSLPSGSASAYFGYAGRAQFTGYKSGVRITAVDSAVVYDAYIDINNVPSVGNYTDRTNGQISGLAFGDYVLSGLRLGSAVEMLRLLQVSGTDNELNLKATNTKITFGAVGGSGQYIGSESSGDAQKMYNSGTLTQIINNNGGTFRALNLFSTRNSVEAYTNRYFALCKQATFDPNAGVSAADFLMVADFTNFSVGFGTTTPNSRAIADFKSVSKGVGLPVLTTTQRNAVSWVSGDAGMIQFNDTNKKFQGWDGTNWKSFTDFQSFCTIDRSVLATTTMNQNIYGFKVLQPYNIGLVNTFKIYVGSFNAAEIVYVDIYTTASARVGGASVTLTATGEVTLTVSSPFPLNSGEYWFTMRATSSAQLGYRSSISNNVYNFITSSYGTGASPSTITTGTSTVVCPLITIN